MSTKLKTTLIVVAMVGMVSLLGCKPNTAYISVSKQTMSIIRPFRLCEPIKIDTVYDVIDSAEPIHNPGFLYTTGGSFGMINSITGCVISQTDIITIYFNPIIKHSEIWKS